MSKVIALYSPSEQSGTWGASHAILPTHSPLFGNILKLSEEPLVFYPFLQQTGACFLPACVDRFLRPHWFLDLLFKHQVILQMKYGSWFSECCLQISSIGIIWKLLSSANRGVAAQAYWKSARSVCEHPLPRLVLPLRQHWEWEALCLKGGLIWPLQKPWLTVVFLKLWRSFLFSDLHNCWEACWLSFFWWVNLSFLWQFWIFSATLALFALLST